MVQKASRCCFYCCTLLYALSLSCHWGWRVIHFFSVWFFMCMSAFLVFHKSYSLVLLFVVRLDSFVSCCNSYAVDNTKRLTGMTKLCCSWLGVRWKLIKLFAGKARRLDYPGTNERVQFRFRKSWFRTIKLSVSNVKIQSLIIVLFCSKREWYAFVGTHQKNRK